MNTLSRISTFHVTARPLSAILIALFCAFIYSPALRSQQVYRIYPGTGFQDLPFPLSEEALTGKIGAPSETRTYAEEEASWEESGYKTSRELQFLLGFDRVLTFENNNPYAIWKAYIMDGKVIVLNCSAYTYTETIISHIQVKDGLHFLDPADKIKHTLGKDYILQSHKGATNRSYIYLSPGIAFIVDESSLIYNILIFPPQTDSKEIKRKLK